MSEPQLLPPDGAEDSGHLALDFKAAEIRRDIAEGGARAFNIGLNLIACKGLVPFGEWRRWVEEQFHWSERTAQRYMKYARAMQRLCGDTGLNPTALSYLPMDVVTAIADAPLNKREQIMGAMKTGYKPTDKQIFDTLYPPVRASSKPIDFGKLSEELSEPIQHPEASAAAAEAVALLQLHLPDDELHRFKKLHTRAGPAFDAVLHGYDEC